MKPAPVGTRSAPNAVEHWRAAFGVLLAAWLAGRKAKRAPLPDAMQELWLGVLREPPPVDVANDARRLLAWLRVALSRRAVDLARRERRRAHQQLDDGACAANEADDGAAREEHCVCVLRVLDYLTRNGDGAAARLLELRYLDGHSVAEIARLLGVSAKATTSRLQRAKKKFRAAWVVAGGGRILTPEAISRFRKFFATHFRVSCDFLVSAPLHRRFAMTRKFFGTVFVLLGLVCLMGASSIANDPATPIPNPGGAALTIEGKGTFAVDPTETFVRIDFFRKVGALPIQEKANTNNAKWDKTVTVAVAGNYDVWAELTTVDNNKIPQFTKTPVNQLAVK